MNLIAKAKFKQMVLYFLMMLVVCTASAKEPPQWSKDFLSFYTKFRSAVMDRNYVDVIEMTCFPFKAFDLTETLDTVPYQKKLRLIGKKTFVKNNLVKYFLTQAGDIPSDTPVVENGITKRLDYLYKNNEQLITENEDPRTLKRLPPDSSGYEIKSQTVFISGLEFTKKENMWCWSYASYVRDDKDKW